MLIAAVTWTVAALVALSIGMEPGESRRNALLLMAFLGFPLGLLIPRYLTPMAHNLGFVLLPDEGSTTVYFMGWLFLFSIGFVQWFILPKIVAMFYRRLTR